MNITAHGALAPAIPILYVVLLSLSCGSHGAPPDAAPSEGDAGSEPPTDAAVADGAIADATRPPDVDAGRSPAALVSKADADASSLRAVARLSAASTCTAFLVASSARRDAPAYVVTNGHCARHFSDERLAYGVLHDLGDGGESAEVIFNFFHDAPEQHIRIRLKNIAYATMKGTDLAIVELAASVGSLADQGLTPLRLASAIPGAATPITVVGAPQLRDSEYLRRARCTEGGAARVVENVWLWHDGLFNDCDGVYPGSSGSPVFNPSGEVFAIVNTTTAESSTGSNCYLGSPCELTATGAVRVPQRNYAMSVVGLGACFDGIGRFTLAAASCPLDRGDALEFQGFAPSRIQAQAAQTWNRRAAPSAAFDWARYKTGAAHETDCRDARGYSTAAPAGADDLANLPIPAAGATSVATVLCVLGSKAGGASQSPQFPSAFVAYRDGAPPMERPQLHFENGTATPVFDLPELAGFQYLVGPTASTVCENVSSWQTFLRWGFPAPTGTRVCLRGSDVVGNRGPIWSYDAP